MEREPVEGSIKKIATRHGRHLAESSYEKRAATRRKPVERSIRRLPRQGRHAEEGSYEKEASKKIINRKHKEDCHGRAGMLKRAATSRKLVEGTIKKIAMTDRHVVESRFEKEASRRKSKAEYHPVHELKELAMTRITIGLCAGRSHLGRLPCHKKCQYFSFYFVLFGIFVSIIVLLIFCSLCLVHFVFLAFVSRYFSRLFCFVLSGIFAIVVYFFGMFCFFVFLATF
jgi:hypothetical protein